MLLSAAMSKPDANQPRVFITSTMDMPFVRDDVEILKRRFVVDAYIGSGPEAIVRILQNTRKAEVSICWFGSVYAFFLVLGVKLWRKKSVIILGGIDVAKDKSHGYGIWLSPWKSLLLKYALHHADKIFVVDDSLRIELRKRIGSDLTTIECLPTGYDAHFWKPTFPKEPLVLCVANCNSWQRAKIKGIDLILAMAPRFPDLQFKVIGVDPAVRAQIPAIPINVDLLPLIPRKEILMYYQAAKIYCQVSRREGLPNALCEALLCGCICIGTEVGGIPTAIREHGFLIESEDTGELETAITEALSMSDLEGLRGRRSIQERFPRERREGRLFETIVELSHANASH